MKTKKRLVSYPFTHAFRTETDFASFQTSEAFIKENFVPLVVLLTMSEGNIEQRIKETQERRGAAWAKGKQGTLVEKVAYYTQQQKQLGEFANKTTLPVLQINTSDKNWNQYADRIENAIVRIKLGRLVSSENEENWWRPELFEKHTRPQIPAALEIVAPPPPEEQNYNCFVYVLGLQNDERFLGNTGWDFTRNLDVIFDEMIAENILEKDENLEAGDLIVYRADNGKISHVGLMQDKNTVLSKWSWGPLLRHRVFDVPDHYGDTVEFYKINERTKDFIIPRYTQKI